MAITYPTTLDAFTNPTAASLLTSPSHAQQHSDINDAVEALETKVAIGNTVLGTYTDYSASQTYSGVTVGNGTTTSYYARVNNFVHFHGRFDLGSTSAITGAVQISLPINLSSTMTGTGSPMGFAYYSDASAGILYPADLIAAGSATFVFTSSWTASGTYVQRGNLSATVPFTWAVSDRIYWNIYYKAA
jgi:hypothetical protein